MAKRYEGEYNEETGEWEYFDIEKEIAKNLDLPQNIIEWFLDRCEQFSYQSVRDISSCSHSSIETTNFSDATVDIFLTESEYSMGNYMGQRTANWSIPKTIFFSNTDAKNWIKGEEKRLDDIEQEKKRIKREAENTKLKLRMEEAAKQKEIDDKLEYERLKTKFKGENNV